MQKVYIAGPMTGKHDFNYPAFDRLSLEWEHRGWAVINPANSFNRNQNLTHGEYIRAAIHLILQADALALMVGWEDSRGAKLEAAIAQTLGLPVYQAEDCRPIVMDATRLDIRAVA